MATPASSSSGSICFSFSFGGVCCFGLPLSGGDGDRVPAVLRVALRAAQSPAAGGSCRAWVATHSSPVWKTRKPAGRKAGEISDPRVKGLSPPTSTAGSRKPQPASTPSREPAEAAGPARPSCRRHRRVRRQLSSAAAGSTSTRTSRRRAPPTRPNPPTARATSECFPAPLFPWVSQWRRRGLGLRRPAAPPAPRPPAPSPELWKAGSKASRS